MKLLYQKRPHIEAVYLPALTLNIGTRQRANFINQAQPLGACAKVYF